MKKTFLIIFSLIIILFAGVMIFNYNYKKTSNKTRNLIINKKIDNFVLPENKFDATMKIPKANIEFSYPSIGFYGLGIEIPRKTSTEEKQGLTQMSTLVEESTTGGLTYNLEQHEFDTKKLSEYVSLYIGYKNKDYIGIGENLKETVELIANTFSQDNIRNGEYKTINNHVFYIYKQSSKRTDEQSRKRYGENGIDWQAITMANDGYLEISFSYGGPGETPESIAAYQNNDKLFLEILEHIKFE